MIPFKYSSECPTGMTDEDVAMFGTTTELPPNLRKMEGSVAEANMFFSFHPRWMDWRTLQIDGYWCQCILFGYHDGTGMLLARPYSASSPPSYFDPEERAQFAANMPTEIQHYWFGLCDHDYKEISQAEAQKRGITHHGNCYHVEVCQDCGAVNAYDSSD